MKYDTQIKDLLPRKVTDREGALKEHSSLGNSAVLDPSSLFKRIMNGFEWENVFPGIRTAMSRWEYCVLSLCDDTINVEGSVLHNLSRSLTNKNEIEGQDIYYHPTRQRVGMGPGAGSSLRKNSKRYRERFIEYYGAIQQDLSEDKLPDDIQRALQSYAKSLVRHGRSEKTLLQKGTYAYHRSRRKAAKNFCRLLTFCQNSAYKPPRNIKTILSDTKREANERRPFIDDLNLILKRGRASKDVIERSAFFRLAFASALLKVLYGIKFKGEEGSAKRIGKAFAIRLLKILGAFKKKHDCYELESARHALESAIDKGRKHIKPPLKHFYELAEREQILQNFRFPTWLRLYRQTLWVTEKDKDL